MTQLVLPARADDPVYSGSCGETLTWRFDPATGTLSIEGSGRMTNYSDDSPVPWQSFRSAITEIEFPEGLSYIGDSAFSRCSALTSLTLPAGLTEIGLHAFLNCPKLSSVSFPAGLAEIGSYAFSDCIGLTSLTLPEGLTSMGISVFSGCTGLKSVTFPESLTSIDYFTFYGCTGLRSVTFPEGMTLIGSYSFSGCTGLTSISLPESLGTIYSNAFEGCTGLRSVTLPEGLTQIDSNVFRYCDALGKVVVKNAACLIASSADTLGVPGTTIIFAHSGSTAQEYAEGYSYSFVSLDDTAFSGPCGAEGDNLLWSFDVEGGVLTITGSGAMADYTADLDQIPDFAPWYFIGSAITEVALPETITRIGSFAFYRCKSLAKVSLPDSLTSIGKYAFAYCTALRELTIPPKVRELSFGLCAGCDSLERIITRNEESAVQISFLMVYDSWEYLFTEGDIHSLGNPEKTVLVGSSREGGYVGSDENGNDCDFEYLRTYAKHFGYTFIPSFSDVQIGAYYYNAVLWAVQNGITSGTGNGKFSPKDTCTRAQVMTFLYAAEGKPGCTNTNTPFTDVKVGAYYYKPVLWAVENNITSGITPTTFGVGNPCTREQVVAFLWKAAGSPAPQSTDCPFIDVKPGKYYYKPVLWAVENGVTGGISATSFGVGQTCTRAQIVTFLYKAYGAN